MIKSPMFTNDSFRASFKKRISGFLGIDINKKTIDELLESAIQAEDNIQAAMRGERGIIEPEYWIDIRNQFLLAAEIKEYEQTKEGKKK